MTTLLVAIGNTLRRDDGVAHRVLDLLGPLPVTASTRTLQQLLPELSEEMAGYDRVLFLDADASPGAPDVVSREELTGPPPPRIERLEVEAKDCGVMGHVMGAGEIVALARSLFGFDGAVWLCRIPVRDFTEGEGLSDGGAANAQAAVPLVREFLQRQT